MLSDIKLVKCSKSFINLIAITLRIGFLIICKPITEVIRNVRVDNVLGVVYSCVAVFQLKVNNIIVYNYNIYILPYLICIGFIFHCTLRIIHPNTLFLLLPLGICAVSNKKKLLGWLVRNTRNVSILYGYQSLRNHKLSHCRNSLSKRSFIGIIY